MVEELAVVISTEGDNALLEIIRNKPCGLCGKTRGCGLSLWGRLLGHRKNVFLAANQINARSGDSVVVGIDEKALLAGSLAMYGIPLLMLLAGAGLGQALPSTWLGDDIRSIAGAGLGLALGLLWTRGHVAGRGYDARYRPVILRQENMRTINLGCHRGDK